MPYRLLVGWLIALLAGCQDATPRGSEPATVDAPQTTRTASSSAAFLTSQPLTVRNDPRQGPLFERLAPEQTGIDFIHRWDPPRRHDREIANAMAGGGVAIGDYNGDGLADLFLTRPQGGCRLYRNFGGWRFRDTTERAGLTDESLWGTGSCFVDVDNDGDLDLYVCAFDGPNRLYINQGSGTFRENARACGLDFHGASVMMAFADYDRDGDLDGYLLTNRLSPPARVQAKAQRVNGEWIVPDQIREYKDLLIKPDGTPFPIDAAQFDHLYRNEGPGPDGYPRFRDVSSDAGIAGNHFGLSATWWDFDDDGFPDLYVSNDFYGPDHLYRNNRDGTFTDVAPLALPHTPWFSMGSDAADLNNDGRLDFLATDMSGTNHFKQKVAMGEMGESGWFLTYPTPHQYMRNAVYLNTGTGRFMEIAYLTGLADTNWTWSVNFADFDNDSRVDLFVSNGMTRDWFHSDLRQAARQLGEWDQGAREFWLDSPPLRERNLAFRNLGDYRFEEVGALWGLDHLGVSFGAAVADLDGDGDLDLVVNNFEEPVAVYRNRSQTAHRIAVRLNGTLGNRLGVGATVQLDTEESVQVRQAWPTHGFMSSGDSSIHFGLGAVERIRKLTVRWPSGHSQVFHDLAANHQYTIAEPSTSLGPESTHPSTSPLPRVPTMFVRTKDVPAIVHREDQYDDFAHQPLLPNRLSQLGPGMAWGDADGDGADDLFVGGASGQPGSLLLQRDGRLIPAPVHQGASWSDPFAEDARCEDMGAVWLDADRDGDLDLYVASGHPGEGAGDEDLKDRLYLNDGRGNLSRAPTEALPQAAVCTGAVAAADMDRDGDLDLFVGARMVPNDYPATPVSQLLRNDSDQGVVRLVDMTDEVAPALRSTGLVTGALWSDVDGDGWIDLLVTHEWGPIRWYRNERGTLVDATRQAGIEHLSGWWNGIAGADLDHDGDIDYVVTNFGLNTKYHASAEQPVRLFYGDFDGTGRRNIVEAEYEDGVLYPVRGKSCSTRAIPMLADRFPTFESFALASLSDIYSPRCLNDAVELSATTLDSGILVNEGHGRLRFVPLPRLAQASPTFGVVVCDFDGDGHFDLFLAQNFFSPQPETGRMDGGVGLVLKGTGVASESGFEPLWPCETGIVLAGDTKSVTVADLNDDGWMDLAAAMNDGPLLAYLNQSGNHVSRPVNIRLVGKNGNPTAVGAQVSVWRSDGLRMVAEVHAGAGYLSQSGPLLAFGLGESLTVQRVDVRWPDGQVTEHAVSNWQNRVVTIEQP